MTMLPMPGAPDTMQPMIDPLMAQLPQVQMPNRGMFGGMFGGKVDLKNVIAGALSGYLASRGNPVGAAGLQALAQAKQLRQRQALEDQQYQRQRQDKRNDFTFEQDYRAQHAPPDDFSQRVAALDALKPGLGMTYAQTYARNGGGLGLVTDAQTGQRYMQPGAAQPPAEAVARLKSNPAEASQFDEIFGQGTSASILGAGGPSPQGSGGF